jgi:hypothetical protein
MDGINPFQLTPAEKTEIRNLCKVIFVGGNPLSQPELKEIYKKYKMIFSIFDIIIDVRYGNFLSLPFTGGAAEQPSKTMECLSLIRALFRKKIEEENNKHLKKH